MNSLISLLISFAQVYSVVTSRQLSPEQEAWRLLPLSVLRSQPFVAISYPRAGPRQKRCVCTVVLLAAAMTLGDLWSTGVAT